MIPNAVSTLDFDLGSDADMLRGSIYSFAQSRIAPIAAEIDKSNEFPSELWQQMGEVGLLGVTVEE
ncbi:MAG: acyl-CoA dehydrogenase family protein, partial [Pseudomonadota bacterium]|nr:acyl-CoA dehydrogenase family protein [Pseudomonadota bacterium]